MVQQDLQRAFCRQIGPARDCDCDTPPVIPDPRNFSATALKSAAKSGQSAGLGFFGKNPPIAVYLHPQRLCSSITLRRFIPHPVQRNMRRATYQPLPRKIPASSFGSIFPNAES